MLILTADGKQLTSLAAVRLMLPLALETMMTRGQALFRRRGKNAVVTMALEVMQLP